VSAEEKLTITVPADVEEALAYIAELSGRTPLALAEQALRQFIEREVPIFEQIEEGMDDFAAGRTVSHDEAMARIRAHMADKAAQAA
jgi:predicted transcriptional regulator